MKKFYVFFPFGWRHIKAVKLFELPQAEEKAETNLFENKITGLDVMQAN